MNLETIPESTGNMAVDMLNGIPTTLEMQGYSTNQKPHFD